VNRATHEQLLAVLEGGTGPDVSSTNGDVVLNLHSFIISVATRLGIGNQVSQRLPADAGQVTVLHSDQLATAQDVVEAIQALSVLLSLVVFALWGLALWFSRGRSWPSPVCSSSGGAPRLPCRRRSV
jgi:hypothetical protein